MTIKDKGFGDTVERFTSATGIKAVVNKITAGSCGCEKRKQWLNEKFPYKK